MCYGLISLEGDNVGAFACCCFLRCDADWVDLTKRFDCKVSLPGVPFVAQPGYEIVIRDDVWEDGIRCGAGV